MWNSSVATCASRPCSVLCVICLRVPLLARDMRYLTAPMCAYVYALPQDPCTSLLFSIFFFVRGQFCLRKVYVWLNEPNIHFAQTQLIPYKKPYTNRTAMGFSSHFGFYKHFWTMFFGFILVALFGSC